MAYSTSDTILATHYNDFVTSVNNLWSTGTGNRGLGQTAVSPSSRSAGNDIAAAEWADMLNKIRLLSDQYGQDGSITIDTVTNPTTGDTISALTTIATDIGTLDAAQIAVVAPAPGYATAVTDTAVVGGTFTNTITQTDTLTFASANAMRYFFNAGGRVYVSWGISSGTADGKYNEWVDLANSKCGTYYIYNTTGGKSGGSGSPSTNLTTTGFWDLGTGTTTMFKQVADTAPYTANYIQLQASLNAAAGSSTVMTLTSTWQDDAADETSFNKAIYNVLDQVDGNKTTTFSYQASATTYISASWGTPTWSTTVNTES
jgi:hypothetical protein